MSDSEDLFRAPEGGVTLRKVLIEDPSSLGQRSRPVELEATTCASDPSIDQTSVSTPSSPDDQEPVNPKWNVLARVFKPSSSPTCDTHTKPHHSDVTEYGIFPHTLEGTNNTTIYENKAEKQLKEIYGHSPAYNPDQPSYRGETLEASRQGMMWIGPYSDDIESGQGLTKDTYPLEYNMPLNNDPRLRSYSSSFRASTGIEGPTGHERSSRSIGHCQRLDQKYTKIEDPETFHKKKEMVPSFPGKVDESFPSLSGPSTKTNTSPSPLPVSNSGCNTKSWASIAAAPGHSTKAHSKSEEEEKTNHHQVPPATSVPRHIGGSWAKVAAGTQEGK
ncbi:hypothetical protein V866_007217 [Kwoniella sp. B9012]